MLRGNAHESVRMAFATLRENRLRSGLTILGIVIGVSTVILISSTINGLNRRVSSWVDSLGSNVFWVLREPLIGIRPTAAMLARKKFTIADAHAVASLPHVIATDAQVDYSKPFQPGAISAKYNGKTLSGAILEGDTSQLPDVTTLPLLEGRIFNESEDQRAAHVCVLGHDAWQALFDGRTAVGKQIDVDGSIFTIIGVADKMKQVFGSGKNPYDNLIYFPIHTFLHLHPEANDLQIAVKYDAPQNKALVEEEIRELLRIRRKVRVQSPDDFDVTSPEALTKLWEQLTGGLALFMIAVSSVGLMVGGVGVMNIMLVSVTERTREIGIRKAIGATKRTILTQFTTEAVTLCALGGAVGICLGAVFTWIVYLLPIGIPATMSPLWVAIGLGVSCAIGLLFGIYPAWKAATLDPIEALRYE